MGVLGEDIQSRKTCGPGVDELQRVSNADLRSTRERTGGKALLKSEGSSLIWRSDELFEGVVKCELGRPFDQMMSCMLSLGKLIP